MPVKFALEQQQNVVMCSLDETNYCSLSQDCIVIRLPWLSSQFQAWYNIGSSIFVQFSFHLKKPTKL